MPHPLQCGMPCQSAVSGCCRGGAGSRMFGKFEPARRRMGADITEGRRSLSDLTLEIFLFCGAIFAFLPETIGVVGCLTRWRITEC